MSNARLGWRQSFQAFLHPRVVSMLFLGFSAGVPLLLIFSSLSVWLSEAGVARSTVTYFSWAALAYSFKFLWAPLVDRLPLPGLTRRLGRRRAWLLLSQLSVILSIVLMAMVNPVEEAALTVMAIAVVMLGFSSATQDIVIDAYRIESVDVDLQALMSSTYIAGYRIGMLVAGAGALVLASSFGSSAGSYNYEAWRSTYLILALIMTIGVLTTLVIREPNANKPAKERFTGAQYIRFLSLFMTSIIVFVGVYLLGSNVVSSAKNSIAALFANAALANFLIECLRLTAGITVVALFIRCLSGTRWYEKELIHQSYILPVSEFFSRFGLKLACLLLVFVGFYRVSDIVLGVIANVFFIEMGFTKLEIATVVKTFGLFMTIVGGFLGGLLSARYGVIRMLYVGAILTVATNLLFMLLASAGNNIELLYLVISADNLTAGLASAAFIAFLSSLTNISFTAVQYAIFSSLMTLLPKVIGGYSGSMVDNLGYSDFFLLASMMGLPVLLLIHWIQRHARFKNL